MLTKIAVIAFAVPVLLAMHGSAESAPIVYDFEADYTEVTMGSLWRYRTVDGSGTLADMVWGAPFGIPGWSPPGDAQTGIFRLGSQVFLHPGLGPSPVVQFVVPTSSWYNLSIDVLDVNDTEGDGIFATFSHRFGTADSPFSGVLASGIVDAAVGSELHFTNQRFLEAGDALNVVIGPRSEPNADTTTLSLVITPLEIPEPGMAAVLTIAFLTIGVRLRNRSRSRELSFGKSSGSQTENHR